MNHLSSLVSAKTELKTSSYGCICDKSVMDALITDYMALGVKAAGTSYKLLNGTRVADNVLPNAKEAVIQG
ncbi:MAG: hypothetical protein H7296_09055 [Bacteroidia bacterium]|nr:hypothetical protein [Bacteroidia bacterium]